MLKVNKKNCIGTVLSLNGFKKYFRLYHAKHQEFYHDQEELDDGSFLGFDDEYKRVEDGPFNRSISQRKSPQVYSIDNLLDGLPEWLNKTFDGITKRYFLDEWPREMK